MIVIMRDAIMPDCCNTCVCSEGYGCGITGTLMKTKEMESRPDWCPLEKVEPCEDTVSREAAMRKVCAIMCGKLKSRCKDTADCGAVDAIKDLPSVTPKADHNPDDEREIADLHKMVNYLLSQQEQQWIPCSERLPEEKDAGILKKFGTSKRSEYVLATVEVKGERMTVTACTYDSVWHWDKKYAFPDYKIIAWMPLPESYREEGGE